MRSHRTLKDQDFPCAATEDEGTSSGEKAAKGEAAKVLRRSWHPQELELTADGEECCTPEKGETTAPADPEDSMQACIRTPSPDWSDVNLLKPVV